MTQLHLMTSNDVFHSFQLLKHYAKYYFKMNKDEMMLNQIRKLYLEIRVQTALNRSHGRMANRLVKEYSLQGILDIVRTNIQCEFKKCKTDANNVWLNTKGDYMSFCKEHVEFVGSVHNYTKITDSVYIKDME